MLSRAGDHVPVIPLLDVVGKADKLPPKQIAATALKVGVTFGVTLMVNVAVVAHSPASGVKVYNVVVVLSRAGDHVPVIPLFEVVGKADNVAPAQMSATEVNVGVTFGFTVIDNVVVLAHCPTVGENV